MHRNQIIGKMPFVGIRDDFGVREATKLLANCIKLCVVQRFARPTALRQRRDEVGAYGRQICFKQFGTGVGQRAASSADVEVGRAQ